MHNDVNTLKHRFKVFSVSVVLFVQKLPSNRTYEAMARQLIRSGTSAASNYRAACRGKSPKDFRAKMGIVEEELDESMYWLELIVAISEDWRPLVTPIWKEANELLAITVASIRTSKRSAH